MSGQLVLPRHFAGLLCSLAVCFFASSPYFATPVSAQETSGAASTSNAGLVGDVADLRNSLMKLNDRIKALESRPEWPAGGYCVLRNGSCPAGFSQHDGALYALYMFAGADIGYVVPGEFGDSYIRWHGANDRKRSVSRKNVAPDWHGEIELSVCCKQQ